MFEALFAARSSAARHRLRISTETNIVLSDDQRKIERIVPIKRNRAHRLIEECMVAANVESAKCGRRRHKLPNLYRIHESARRDEGRALREFLAAARL